MKARLGDKDNALKITKKILSKSGESKEVNYQIAAVYSILNDLPQSMKYLNKAVSLGYKDFSYLDFDPDFENLRKSKDYQSLIKSMKKVSS